MSSFGQMSHSGGVLQFAQNPLLDRRPKSGARLRDGPAEFARRGVGAPQSHRDPLVIQPCTVV